MTERAVFLDRDGILVRAEVRGGKPFPPANLESMQILPGIADGLTRLKAQGVRLIVITNQVDVGRGRQTQATVEQMHDVLRQRLPLDDIFVCYRDEETTRVKPAHGMLLEAANKWAIDLKHSFMVGDRWKDMEAGQKAGCRVVFVDYGYDEPKPASVDFMTHDPVKALAWIGDQL